MVMGVGLCACVSGCWFNNIQSVIIGAAIIFVASTLALIISLRGHDVGINLLYLAISYAITGTAFYAFIWGCWIHEVQDIIWGATVAIVAFRFGSSMMWTKVKHLKIYWENP